jgi:hypothetical protein
MVQWTTGCDAQKAAIAFTDILELQAYTSTAQELVFDGLPTYEWPNFTQDPDAY